MLWRLQSHYRQFPARRQIFGSCGVSALFITSAMTPPETETRGQHRRLARALAGRGCRGLSPEERRPLTQPNPSRQVCTYHQAGPIGSATAVAGASELMEHAQTAQCRAATTLGSSTYQPLSARGLTGPRIKMGRLSSIGLQNLTDNGKVAIIQNKRYRHGLSLGTLLGSRGWSHVDARARSDYENRRRGCDVAGNIPLQRAAPADHTWLLPRYNPILCYLRVSGAPQVRWKENGERRMQGGTSHTRRFPTRADRLSFPAIPAITPLPSQWSVCSVCSSLLPPLSRHRRCSPVSVDNHRSPSRLGRGGPQSPVGPAQGKGTARPVSWT